MKGIDISNNNESIDFTQVKNAGIEVVYIKATEGINFTDSYLEINYASAKAAGLEVGFYHFLGHDDPITEAKYFLNATSGLTADCLYICDAEGDDWSIAEVSSAVRQFADYLIGQGKQVGIYTGDYFYRDNLDSTVKDLPLWVACYGGTPMASNYVGLQYSETGTVPGINTNVDLDTFTEGILVQEEKKVEYLVVVNRGADENSAEILADYLNCPVIKNDRQFDYSCVKNVIGVGGNSGQYTSYLTKLIAGSDRYTTDQAVLDFIKNEGK